MPSQEIVVDIDNPGFANVRFSLGPKSWIAGYAAEALVNDLANAIMYDTLLVKGHTEAHFIHTSMDNELVLHGNAQGWVKLVSQKMAFPQIDGLCGRKLDNPLGESLIYKKGHFRFRGKWPK